MADIKYNQFPISSTVNDETIITFSEQTTPPLPTIPQDILISKQTLGNAKSRLYPWLYSGLVYKKTGEAQSIPRDTLTTVKLNDKVYDNGDEYNTSNGIFTSTDGGVYHVSVNLELLLVSPVGATNHYYYVTFVSSSHGSFPYYKYLDRYRTTGAEFADTIYLDVLVRVDPGHTLITQFYHDVGNGGILAQAYTKFSMHKIAPPVS